MNGYKSESGNNETGIGLVRCYVEALHVIITETA